MLELVIHRGTSFSRGVYLLSEDCKDVQDLKETIARVVPVPADNISEEAAMEMLFEESMSENRQRKSQEERLFANTPVHINDKGDLEIDQSPQPGPSGVLTVSRKSDLLLKERESISKSGKSRNSDGAKTVDACRESNLNCSENVEKLQQGDVDRNIAVSRRITRSNKGTVSSSTEDKEVLQNVTKQSKTTSSIVTRSCDSSQNNPSSCHKKSKRTNSFDNESANRKKRKLSLEHADNNVSSSSEVIPQELEMTYGQEDIEISCDTDGLQTQDSIEQCMLQTETGEVYTVKYKIFAISLFFPIVEKLFHPVLNLLRFNIDYIFYIIRTYIFTLVLNSPIVKRVKCVKLKQGQIVQFLQYY